jgi:hypothetical protein
MKRDAPPGSTTLRRIGVLEVRSIYPTGAPLPIAENGHYAHSFSAWIVRAAGGPVAWRFWKKHLSHK